MSHKLVAAFCGLVVLAWTTPAFGRGFGPCGFHHGGYGGYGRYGWGYGPGFGIGLGLGYGLGYGYGYGYPGYPYGAYGPYPYGYGAPYAYAAPYAAYPAYGYGAGYPNPSAGNYGPPNSTSPPSTAAPADPNAAYPYDGGPRAPIPMPGPTGAVYNTPALAPSGLVSARSRGATTGVDSARIERDVQMLSSSSEIERQNAVMDLGRSGAIRAVDPLSATLAGDASAAVREAAARALGLIAAPNSLPALIRAAQADNDRDVRRSAQFAIEIIRSNLRNR